MMTEERDDCFKFNEQAFSVLLGFMNCMVCIRAVSYSIEHRVPAGAA